MLHDDCNFHQECHGQWTGSSSDDQAHASDSSSQFSGIDAEGAYELLRFKVSRVGIDEQQIRGGNQRTGLSIPDRPAGLSIPLNVHSLHEQVQVGELQKATGRAPGAVSDSVCCHSSAEALDALPFFCEQRHSLQPLSGLLYVEAPSLRKIKGMSTS